MECQIVYSSIFKEWWQSLDINEKESVLAYIDLLGMCGVKLSYPYCSKINDKRWYTKNIKIADKIYCEYLISLKGEINKICLKILIN